MKPVRAMVWLRRDLRLHDHRVFFEATQTADQVLLVFIIDDQIVAPLDRHDRRVTFIQTCLDEMQLGLAALGGRLLVQKGDPAVLIPSIAADYQVEAVYAGRDYEPDAKARDERVASELAKQGARLVTVKDQVIFERREILSQSGDPYKVFTPYSRTWVQLLESKKSAHLREFKPDYRKLLPASEIRVRSASFYDFGFEPQRLSIKAGEKAARSILNGFSEMVPHYQETRDFPAIEGTSSLSPHFRFGTLSIREAVRFCYEHFSSGTKVWMKELIWREFYQMILDQYPQVVGHAFRPEYDQIQWPGKKEHFEAWCEGRTGFPIVDAAMRQLNQTGWMHNRLRMVVAMFLTKDLLIDWRWGEAYFSKQLLDYDLASNNGGWQWSASTGCDAQPYFRIFNPDSQAKKFDPEQKFIRRFIPELGTRNYPKPIVDHAVQREKAIQLFKF